MKRSAYVVLAVSLAGSSALRAQATSQPQQPIKKTQETGKISKGTTLDARDSVTVADIQRAADELARTVQRQRAGWNDQAVAQGGMDRRIESRRPYRFHLRIQSR